MGIFDRYIKKKNSKKEAAAAEKKKEEEMEAMKKMAAKAILFGEPLKEIITISMLVELIDFIERDQWIGKQGLYRRPGSKKRINDMMQLYDTALPVDIDECKIMDICSLLKLYFRSLPEPLFTYDLHEEFVAAATVPPEYEGEDEDEEDGELPDEEYVDQEARAQARADAEEKRIERLKATLQRLPAINYQVMRYLFSHLVKVTQYSYSNKMDSHNIGVCFAPSLMRHKSATPLTMASYFSGMILVISTLINQFDVLFDVTPEKAVQLSKALSSPQWREIATGTISMSDVPQYMYIEPTENLEKEDFAMPNDMQEDIQPVDAGELLGKHEKQKEMEEEAKRKAQEDEQAIQQLVGHRTTTTTTPAAEDEQQVPVSTTTQQQALSSSSPPKEGELTPGEQTSPPPQQQITSPPQQTSSPQQTSPQQKATTPQTPQTPQQQQQQVTPKTPMEQQQQQQPQPQQPQQQATPKTSPQQTPQTPQQQQVTPKTPMEQQQQQQTPIEKQKQATPQTLKDQQLQTPVEKQQTASPVEKQQTTSPVVVKEPQNQQDQTTPKAPTVDTTTTKPKSTPKTPEKQQQQKQQQVGPINATGKSENAFNITDEAILDEALTIENLTATRFGYKICTSESILEELIRQTPKQHYKQLAESLYELGNATRSTVHLVEHVILIIMRIEKLQALFSGDRFSRHFFDVIIAKEATEFIQQVLTPPIRFIIETPSARLSLNESTVEGTRVQRQAVVQRDQNKLKSLLDLFSKSIFSVKSANRVPTLLRYASTFLYDILQREHASVENIEFIVAQLMIQRLYCPTIAYPGLRNIGTADGRAITPDHYTILGYVTEVINMVIARKKYGFKELDMHFLNKFMPRFYDPLTEFIQQLMMRPSELRSVARESRMEAVMVVAEDQKRTDDTYLQHAKTVRAIAQDCNDQQMKSELKKEWITLLSLVTPSTIQSLLKKNVDTTETAPSLATPPSSSKQVVPLRAIRDMSQLIPRLNQPLLLEGDVHSTIMDRIVATRLEMNMTPTSDLSRLSNFELVVEKDIYKRELLSFDEAFTQKHGTKPTKNDKEVIRDIYSQYAYIRSLLTQRYLTYSTEQMVHISRIAGSKEPLKTGSNVQQGVKVSSYSLNALTSKDSQQTVTSIKTNPEYQQVRAAKREVQQLLHQYETYFKKTYKRPIRHVVDREPMRRYYDIYKFLKFEVVRVVSTLRQQTH